MPPVHAAQRPRIFAMCVKNAKPQHGHFLEYAMAVINIFVQICFLYGSYLFLSSETLDLEWGDSLFIFGSVVTFVFAGFNLVESRAHWKNYKQAEREDRIEFWEATLFFFAGLVFLVGSIFYWPGIYDTFYEGQNITYIHDMEESGEAHGARLFISGSFLFLIASMFNAIGLGMNKKENEKNQVAVVTHYIHVVALLCSQMGSVLFVAGSWMYRPAIGHACPDFSNRYEGEAQEGEPVAEHACETTGAFGTQLYIIGSLLYLAEAVLGFTNSILKGAYINDGKVGHNEIKAATGDGSDIEDNLVDPAEES